MRGNRLSIGLRAALAIIAATFLATNIWAATNEKVLHSFSVTDGAAPYAGLIFDAVGHLYGTTSAGGTYGQGTVFELTPTGGGSWTEQVLYSFCSLTNCTDGAAPYAGLIFDRAGNLYGTTQNGGTSNGCEPAGCGTVFELTPAAGGGWTETVLYSFRAYPDGANPSAGLIFDAAGNLYGTTSGGGIYGGSYGDGTVFELTPAAGGGWTEQVLHYFGNDYDGYDPEQGLIFDAAGNLYGMTHFGGVNDCLGNYYCGTVFELSPMQGGGWTEQLLLSFNGADGWYPYGGLILDAAGNLYGTTTGAKGGVFELMPMPGGGWTEQVLYNFGPYPDGNFPTDALIFDAAGNLYGTTDLGGTGNCYNGAGDVHCGTVFELSPIQGRGWTETVLYNFNWNGNGTDGTNPLAGLIFDAAKSNLYGTTQNGGTYGYGTVFEITPKVLYALSVSETGSGTITSNDGYINCGSTCSHAYLSGSQVTLTASPAQGWALAGWTGCDQSQSNVCVVTMNSARNVTATFKLLYTLSVMNAGGGTVSSVDEHIYCGNACSYTYIDGTEVTLSAVPSPGYSFTGWMGCDNVNGSYCAMTMTSAKNVSAAFSTANVTLTSLTFKPSYVRGGQLSAGTLTLSGPAPQGGVTVALSSDHPGVAHPPSFLFVSGGKSSVQFAVNTFPVKSNTTVTITATAGASHISGTLTVGTTSLPPSLK